MQRQWDEDPPPIGEEDDVMASTLPDPDTDPEDDEEPEDWEDPDDETPLLRGGRD